MLPAHIQPIICMPLHAILITGAAFLMWELSTPFVNVRWLLAKMGRDTSRLYVANGLAMVVVFFLCRNVWGTYCSVRFFQATQAELDSPRPGGFSAGGIWGYRIANVSLNLLNLYWFTLMVRKAAAQLSGGGRQRKAGGVPKQE